MNKSLRTHIQMLGIALLMLTCCPMGAAASSDGPGKGYTTIPESAFSVVAEVWAKPGKANELRSATIPLIFQVRSDPKNLVYFLQEDRNIRDTSFSMRYLRIGLTLKLTIKCHT